MTGVLLLLEHQRLGCPLGHQLSSQLSSVQTKPHSDSSILPQDALPLNSKS